MMIDLALKLLRSARQTDKPAEVQLTLIFPGKGRAKDQETDQPMLPGKTIFADSVCWFHFCVGGKFG